MKQILSTWWGVSLAAAVTTLAAITVTQVMVFFLFQGQDLRAALTLAPFIALVVTFPFSFFIWTQVRSNIRLSLELQRLVNRDRLTDVATRDFFFARMRDEPSAYGISLMVDIDHFKVVNDTFGHMAGDAVIARVARILLASTRGDDIVCRFGGEEFVIFLAGQNQQDGFEAAERMRQAIAEDVTEFAGNDLRVTVSIGGSLKERLHDIDLAIQEADRALYLAKGAGRNRTVLAKKDVTDTAPADA